MVTTIHYVALNTPLPCQRVEGRMVTTIHLAFNRIGVLAAVLTLLLRSCSLDRSFPLRAAVDTKVGLVFSAWFRLPLLLLLLHRNLCWPRLLEIT